MKILKSLLVATMLLVSINVSAQTLEGKWMGYDASGNLLRVEFRNDFTCFFSVNNVIVHTIDYEPYYNYVPNRVQINYTPLLPSGVKGEIRVKAGIFEYVAANKLKFQYMESDGSLYPTTFQGGYLLHSVTSFDLHQAEYPDL